MKNTIESNKLAPSLLLTLAFASLLSVINLPFVFTFIILAMIFISWLIPNYLKLPSYISSKLLSKVLTYIMVIIALFAIWQQLVIPSLLAIIAVLTIVAWAKLTELKSSRDTYLIWLISAVVIAINTLLLIEYQLAIILLGILLLFISASEFSQQFNRNVALKLSMLIASSLPFALILFMTLPRINLPMQELGLVMGLPITVEQDKSRGDKGLGRELSFGDIGELGNSNTRVLLASMPSGFELPTGENFYWRGPVYWQYQNQKWKVRDDFNKRQTRQRNGWGSNSALTNMTQSRDHELTYSVVLQPHGEYWLYGLDLPKTLTGESYLSQDYQLLSIRTIDKTWRYKISASLGYDIKAKEPQVQLDLGLRYPDNNPQTKALGEQWRQNALINDNQNQQGINELIVEQAKNFFTQERFLYANSDHQYQGNNLLDQFIFERKVGYSQHYASALTLLLRAANVPARLVGGYRGAEKVGLTNFYVVNEHHAHAWVEAWLGPQGKQQWQRIDPALWVADIFTSQTDENTNTLEADNTLTDQQRQEQRDNQQAMSTIQRELSQKSQQQQGEQDKKSNTNWLDTLGQWTIDFDADKQASLVASLGFKNILWWQLLLAALCIIAVIALIYYGVIRYLSAAKDKPLHVQAYHQLCTKLAKVNLTRLSHEGSQSYFNRCAKQAPQYFDYFNALMKVYLPLCYSSLTPAQYQQKLIEFKQLAKQVKQIKQVK